MSIPSFEVRKRQLLYAGLASLFGLSLIGLLLWSLGGDLAQETTSSTLKETSITTAGQQVNPQEVWVERMESENKLTNDKLNALEKLLMVSIQENAKKQEPQKACPTAVMDSDNQSSSGIQVVLPPQPSGEEESQGLDSLGDNPLRNNSHVDNPLGDNPQQTSSGVRKIILKLSNPILDSSLESPQNPGRSRAVKSSRNATLENTLPAGAFAKAILLGGVDASTSIAAPSDPRPVLLRVTDHGNLPRKFKSDLKACHLLASSYGDLSSERVYMRLEKLTCTESLTGEISETQVAGYVVGEDGRAGVRGIVVDKAGPLIRNSLIGGFFSGMGQFFENQQQRAFLPLSPNGQTPLFSPQQMLTAGGLSGTSNALEKYAEFFIKRAEQLQPVLQVAAGREVDVVFTQGTKFGDTTVRQSLSKIRERSRKQTLQQLEGQGDNQDWRPEDYPPGNNSPRDYSLGNTFSENSSHENTFNNSLTGDDE